MAFNGSGTFVRLYNWVQDAANSILIRADRMDGEMDGFATGLSNCLTRDGQGKPSANIDWNAKKLTNLGVGTALTDAASLGDIQSGRLTYLTGVAGTNTITGNAVITGVYAAGNTFSFVAAGANTGAVTLNVNGLGAKSVFKNVSANLVAGEIPSGALITVTYDGTNFQITGVMQTSSLGSNGWSRLSNGTIEQWGAASTTAGSGAITFPIAFPTACYSVVIVESSAAGWSTTNLTVYGIAAVTTTGATARSFTWTGSGFTAGGGGFYYRAVGS